MKFSEKTVRCKNCDKEVRPVVGKDYPYYVHLSNNKIFCYDSVAETDESCVKITMSHIAAEVLAEGKIVPYEVVLLCRDALREN